MPVTLDVAPDCSGVLRGKHPSTGRELAIRIPMIRAGVKLSVKDDHWISITTGTPGILMLTNRHYTMPYRVMSTTRVILRGDLFQVARRFGVRVPTQAERRPA